MTVLQVCPICDIAGCKHLRGDTIDALKAERDQLLAENESATSWGAAVGARQERIKEINGVLAAKAAPTDRGPIVGAPSDDYVAVKAMVDALVKERDEARAEVARLRKALRPFASPPLYALDGEVRWIPARQPEDWIGGGRFSSDDFRSACAALQEKKP